MSGHVRFYPNPDGDWGDIHYNDFGGSNDIHLHTDNFLNQHELGVTLMHEGYHGYYDYRDDPPAPNNPAENFAQSCVLN